MITVLSARVNAQASGPCAGQKGCMAVRSFVATVTDFRQSTSGRDRLVSITVRFQNRLTTPLTLGYVQNSGVATDDQGVRYVVWGAGAIRGIGEITGNTFDSKFTLEPGESSDARFEFGWRPTGNQIYGTTFDFDLAVREIDRVGANQFRLGKEYALQFRGFGAGTITVANQSNDASPSTTPTQVASSGSVAPLADPCAARPRCYSSGPFIAEVTQVTPSRAGRHHVVKLNIKFRNLTNQPVILGYHSGSAVMIDNFGNRYYWGRAGTHDQSASGIGIVAGRSADPQFVLSPGESRDATFQMIRYEVGNSAIGTSFTYDASFDQLEVLPGNQVRSTRQYAANFKDLVPGASGAGAAQLLPDTGVAQSAKKLFDDIRKKIKKPN
jgi:hypothetical protein